MLLLIATRPPCGPNRSLISDSSISWSLEDTATAAPLYGIAVLIEGELVDIEILVVESILGSAASSDFRSGFNFLGGAT